MSAILGVIAVISSLFCFVYLYMTRNFNFWKKYGIPYLKPTPFVGNLGQVFLQKVDIGNHLKNLYLRNKDKPFVGMFSFDKPALLVNDLELVKNVLVKEFQYFTDRNISVKEDLDPMFARTVFSLKGQEWKHVRTHLSPIFTSGKMKNMFYLVDDCAKELDNFLENTTAHGEKALDVKDLMARYTTDSITSCAFGLESNAIKDPKSVIRSNLKTFVEYSMVKGAAALFLFFAPTLQNIFRLKFVDNATADFLRKTIWDTVDYREKTGTNRKDFIDHLIGLSKKTDVAVNGKQIKIEGDTLVAQSFGFFFAGFETSASTMTFALYEMAFQPEIQTRLREEIKEVLSKHNGKVTYEAVQEMTYLDMVVSETLRKYPVLGFLDRACIRDYELPAVSGKGTVTLKAGTSVYIPLFGIQMDPKYYPDPEKFDPERFLEENKQKRPAFTYLPFGEGPRICIGMRFGLMQVKIGLIHILTRFEAVPCRETPRPLKYNARSFLISIEGELPLTFKRLVIS